MRRMISLTYEGPGSFERRAPHALRFAALGARDLDAAGGPRRPTWGTR